MATDDIFVIDRLMDEHLRIVDCTSGLREAYVSGSVEDAAAAAARLRALLAAHHELEDALFAVLHDEEEFVEHIDRLLAQHGRLACALACVEGGELDGVPTYLTQLREHLDAEDEGVFPAAITSLGADGWSRVLALHSSVTAGG